MKNNSILFSIFIIILFASCESEASRKATAEVERLEWELKRDEAKNIRFKSCLESEKKLMEAGLSEKEAAIKADEIDSNCNCVDSLNAKKEREKTK